MPRVVGKITSKKVTKPQIVKINLIKPRVEKLDET
jgi:hypothetical protein